MSSILNVIAKEFIVMPMVIDLMGNPETVVFPMEDDCLAISARNGQVAFLFSVAREGVKLVGGKVGERETMLDEPEDMPARTAEKLRLIFETVLEMEDEELIPSDKVEDGDRAATMAAVKKALDAKGVLA